MQFYAQVNYFIGSMSICASTLTSRISCKEIYIAEKDAYKFHITKGQINYIGDINISTKRKYASKTVSINANIGITDNNKTTEQFSGQYPAFAQRYSITKKVARK